MTEQIAVIDIGSNSIRMSIMQVGEHHCYRMVCQMKEALRLSAQIDGAGELPPPAVERMMQVLRAFARQIRLHKVTQVRAVATAALRRAENREHILQKVKQETGLQVEVISGETEAYYDYLGVIYTVPLEDFVLLDTGGGSTEIVLVEQRKMTARVSIPYGAVVLQKQFGDNIGERQRLLKKTIRGIPFLHKCKGKPVVGLGGSIRALGKAHCTLRRHPLVSIHEYTMSYREAAGLYRELCQLSPLKREQRYDISDSRCDIITAGLAPLIALMEETEAKQLVISGNGVREGIFYEHCIPFPADMHVLRSSVANCMQLYQLDKAFAEDLYREASILAAPYPTLIPYGHILYVACMLSEIGKQIEYYNHSRHTFFILTGLPLYGLSPVEKVMCALVAAGIGKGAGKGIYAKFYGMLTKEQAMIARQLATIKQVAETLLFYGFQCAHIVYGQKKEKLSIGTVPQENGLVLPDVTRNVLQKRWRSSFRQKCQLVEEQRKEHNSYPGLQRITSNRE